MAMVKIQKGDKVIKVPMGAFNSNYKKAGWNLVGKVGGQKNAETAWPSTQNDEIEVEEEFEHDVDEVEGEEEQEEEDEWDEAEKELEKEKDIDSMDMNELKAKAKDLGINPKNLSTVGDYRKAIKKALSKQ